MRNIHGHRTSRVLLVALALLGSAAVARSQSDESSKQQDRIGLILHHLPLKTSRAYLALRKAAGDATGEILPMTKSEMWSIPKRNLEQLQKLAKTSGVEIRELDDQSSSALAPMKSGAKMTDKQNQMMQEAKERVSTMGVTMMALPEPAVLEYALTRGMNSPDHGAQPPVIMLKLNSTTTITVRRTSVVKDGDSYIWHGAIEGTGEPVTLVCWPQGRLAGNILHAGHMYSVQSLGGGMHAVIETAPKMLPPEHEPMDSATKQKMNMIDDPLVKSGDANMLMEKMTPRGENSENLRDLLPIEPGSAPGSAKPNLASAPSHSASSIEPVTIALIAAYTKAAASHYSDIRKDLIALAIAETNQSFKASGIPNLQIKLVHAYETKYIEKGTHFEHVFQFTEKGDGVLDEIHRLRDKHSARRSADRARFERLRFGGRSGRTGRTRIRCGASWLRSGDVLARTRNRPHHWRASRSRFGQQHGPLRLRSWLRQWQEVAYCDGLREQLRRLPAAADLVKP